MFRVRTASRFSTLQRRARLTGRSTFPASGIVPAAVAVDAGAPPERRRRRRPHRGHPLSTFGEVAGRGYPLPMTPWAAELKKKRMADNMKDNPDVWCLPIGLMHTTTIRSRVRSCRPRT